MSDVVLLSTAYLAPVSYYAVMLAYPSIRMERHEHFIKQTFRNRCTILSPEGPQNLIVPIQKGDASHTEIKDIQLSDHGNWRHLHWQALVTAYEGSPYFEYYADEFRPFYEKPYKYLFDYNEALRQKICELLDMQPQVVGTEKYENAPEVDDYRLLISPKTKQVVAGFRPHPYYQVFQNRWGFVENLSIVDLLFNMGPEGLLILRDSFASIK